MTEKRPVNRERGRLVERRGPGSLQVKKAGFLPGRGQGYFGMTKPPEKLQVLQQGRGKMTPTRGDWGGGAHFGYGDVQCGGPKSTIRLGETARLHADRRKGKKLFKQMGLQLWLSVRDTPGRNFGGRSGDRAGNGFPEGEAVFRGPGGFRFPNLRKSKFQKDHGGEVWAGERWVE